VLVAAAFSADDYDSFEAYERAREELGRADDQGSAAGHENPGSRSGHGAVGDDPSRGLKKDLAEVDAQLKRDWNQHVTLSQVRPRAQAGVATGRVLASELREADEQAKRGHLAICHIAVNAARFGPLCFISSLSRSSIS